MRRPVLIDSVTPLPLKLARLGAALLMTTAAGALVAVAGFSVQAARNIMYPARMVDAVTPADHQLSYEDVSFLSLDGIQLRGWFVPGGPAAIILAHGHAGNRAGMLGHADYLHVAGYSVLMFDFRGHGESDGRLVTLGYYEWQDVAGALRYLQAQSEVDPKRIGALGNSMGAASVLLLGEHGRELRAIVADSGFTSAQVLISRFGSWFRLPEQPFATTVSWLIRLYSGLAPSDVAPLGRVKALAPTPLFLIHSEEDTGIPVEDARLLYEAALPPKELWIIPKGGHGAGYDVEKEEYERRVLEFFGRYLQ